jgi:hypothetical protein
VLTQTIAAVVFIVATAWSALRYISLRKCEIQHKRFKDYHSLIKDFVQPDASAHIFLDRQIATAFEMRNFPEYYELTHRLFEGLKKQWTLQGVLDERLSEEMQRTIDHIEKRKRWWPWKHN